MSELLKLENISFAVENLALLKSEEKVILKNISFNMEKGTVLGIAGESGSGKTTLAKVIAGIYKTTSGKIFFNHSDEWKNLKTKPVQILFQNNGEILNPFRDIETLVEEALLIRYGKNKNLKFEKEKIFNTLNFPAHLWNRKGYELSGGEQQRAALARILSVNPELLILDEPFSAQDVESQLNLLQLFYNLKKQFGVTIICISHDLKLLRKLCDKIIIMYNGEIVEQGNSMQIFTKPEHPYTKFLLNAVNFNLKYDELKFEIN